MNSFVFNSRPNFEIDVIEKFIYNFYHDDESITSDNSITNSINSTYKSVSLDIQSRSVYDNRILPFLSLANLDFLENKQDTNLNNDDLKYFNKIISSTPEYLNTYLDISYSEINNINSYYNITFNEHSSAIWNTLTSRKLTLNNNFDVYRDFLESNKENIFFTNKVKDTISSYISFVDYDLEDAASINKLVLNKNFIPFHVTSVYNSSNFTPYYLHVGYLIEKYIKNSGMYTKKASYFSYYSKNNEIIYNEARSPSNTTVINDVDVKYGQTYRYVIYPVYYIMMPTKKNYHTIDHFIVCDYPYFTSDVECVETTRPIPPALMSFSYSENKQEMSIEWSTPLERQGDIKGYQIFKRNSLDDPFVLINQIEFHNKNDMYTRNSNVSESIVARQSKTNNNTFIDKDFKKDRVQIYAMCSIDARGLTSNYSSQYGVKYIDGKCDADLISASGAPLHMPNLLLPRRSKYFENEDYLVSNVPIEEKVSKFTLYVTPEFNRVNTISADPNSFETVLKENYKMSIFKLENSSTYTDTITLSNVNNI